MDSYKTNLQKVLRSVRVASGFSQRQVAEILRISRSAYTYYEVGKTIPDVPTLRALANIYRVPVEIFIFPEKYPDFELKKARVRRRQKPLPHPLQFGELTPEEKACVIRFRMRAKPTEGKKAYDEE